MSVWMAQFFCASHRYLWLKKGKEWHRVKVKFYRPVMTTGQCCPFTSFLLLLKEEAWVKDAGRQLSIRVHLHAGISCNKICPLKQWPNLIKLNTGWALFKQGMKRWKEQILRKEDNTAKQVAALSWCSANLQNRLGLWDAYFANKFF